MYGFVQIKVKVAANARVRLSLQEVEKPKDVMEKFVFVCVESGRLSDIHLVLLVPLVTSQIRKSDLYSFQSLHSSPLSRQTQN
uniref:FERM domain-containing protein n=1 Tax=Astatotilapia calliptera TaxID=8154 RepID=A0AAX7TG33_ASTCA